MMALTVLRYTLLLLIIPAYFIALSRHRWATIPLWLVSTAVMLTQYLMATQQGAAFGTGAADGALIYAGEMTKIMLIPTVVQFVVILHGMGVGVSGRPSRVSRKLVEVFDAGER